MFKNKLYFVGFTLSLFLLCLFPIQINAATYGTIGVDTGCGGNCSGWYANHFNAQIIAEPVGGNLMTSSFKGTLTSVNQFGDQWTIMRLVAWSNGSKVLDNTSKASDLRKEANSSYWQNISSTVPLVKGDNKVDFNFGYILKNKNGGIEERWYPIRRASNKQ